ncbi:MAG: hypothetical protein GF383_13305, partial [Candidatus Lokiarchaeota archaeon]|nr:hypothetical protein [Candidatus Lokiarchaeota archaeon]MBD3342161.1 hypothetical protein [Candidatus Lokiarchaeota archaeon]
MIKKFTINKHIDLILTNKCTNIYITGKPFKQCRYLVFHLDKEKLFTYDRIRSIDEMESTDRSKEYYKINIDHETEFWAHCSNLQAWAENDYDSRLLHRNLAFPFLKALMKAGDLKARKVIKEEIAKRFNNGSTA